VENLGGWLTTIVARVGTGFACGETRVLVNGVPQPATAMVSLTCSSIVMRGWPPAGASPIVRTSGGGTAPIPVP
jgi:hypothetical protein